LEIALVYDGSGKLPVPKFQAQLVCSEHGTAISSSLMTSVDVAFHELATKGEELFSSQASASNSFLYWNSVE
jgi:hypothetical protein